MKNAYIEINITPRAWGNIAAAAMAHGCDVTTYLVRHATTQPTAAPSTTTGAPASTATPEHTTAPASAAAPAPEPVPHRPVPAGSAGMFDAI